MISQKRKSIWLLVAILSILGVTTIAAGSLWYLWQPVDARDERAVTFVVPRGRATTLVARDLQSAGLIRNQVAFHIARALAPKSETIQAGSFQLKKSMSPNEIYTELTHGTNDVWITIKEGMRATEIGELLRENLIDFDPESEEFQRECIAYEGQLFPETYLFPKTFTARQVCQKLRQQYGEVFTMEDREVVHNAGRSEEETMTLASIIEREAKKPNDMKMVAGVLLNRLEVGMPLQVDASLQYIKGYDESQKTWWAPPLAADKSIKSPYNTYLNPGLPPGPICNPGKNALEAAIRPTKNEYLYYISNTDGTQMYFAKTYEEHQENIAKHLR